MLRSLKTRLTRLSIWESRWTLSVFGLRSGHLLRFLRLRPRLRRMRRTATPPGSTLVRSSPSFPTAFLRAPSRARARWRTSGRHLLGSASVIQTSSACSGTEIYVVFTEALLEASHRCFESGEVKVEALFACDNDPTRGDFIQHSFPDLDLMIPECNCFKTMQRQADVFTSVPNAFPNNCPSALRPNLL